MTTCILKESIIMLRVVTSNVGKKEIVNNSKSIKQVKVSVGYKPRFVQIQLKIQTTTFTILRISEYLDQQMKNMDGKNSLALGVQITMDTYMTMIIRFSSKNQIMVEVDNCKTICFYTDRLKITLASLTHSAQLARLASLHRLEENMYKLFPGISQPTT